MQSGTMWVDWDGSGPIDLAEDLAANHEWEFNRIDDNHINFVVAGQWQHYSAALVMCDDDETLRFMCSFDLNMPKNRQSALRDLICLANDQCWGGSFSQCSDHSSMIYRYGLLLCDGAIATQSQIDAILISSIETCERFYPAFQLVCRAGKSPQTALDLAITDVSGNA